MLTDGGPELYLIAYKYALGSWWLFSIIEPLCFSWNHVHPSSFALATYLFWTGSMISFTSKLFALALAIASTIYASASALPRQVTSNKGTINAPTSGTLVSSNSSIPFSYSDRNWCEDGYSPVSLWLTDYEPTISNLNVTGQFSEGDFTYYFGLYTNPNFGMYRLSLSVPFDEWFCGSSYQY